MDFATTFQIKLLEIMGNLFTEVMLDNFWMLRSESKKGEQEADVEALQEAATG